MKEIIEKITIISDTAEYKAAFDHNDINKVFLDDELYDVEVLKEYGNDVYSISINDEIFTAKIKEDGKESIEILGTGFIHEFDIKTKTSALLEKFVMENKSAGPGIEGVTSPMPGLVVKINCIEGDDVKLGDKILIVEAMKMENTLTAPKDGKIKSIKVEEGKPVEKGQLLIEIE